MNDCDVLILGSGFSGLSSSYHLGHERCVILERSNTLYGHCRSHTCDGVIWDEGPHVSFTKNEYVRELFSNSVESNYADYEVAVGNYFKGVWIDHPAQVNLYQIPEPLRSECLVSFLKSSEDEAKDLTNYGEWLEAAFGKVFAHTFPAAYTRKYWTCDPKELEISWVGQRVYRPSNEDVIRGSKAAIPDKKHYITEVRYPKKGGYEAFGRQLSEGADVRVDHEVTRIDLEKRVVYCSNGEKFSYQRLVSTIPLPVFVSICEQSTSKMKKDAEKLACTAGYLVNVLVPHASNRPENWFYVYDEDKLSTRITFSEKFDGEGKDKNYSAIQVEVYQSVYKGLKIPAHEIIDRVVGELYELGLIDTSLFNDGSQLKSHITELEWGNVIFDHYRKNTLETILNGLTTYGLVREVGDLSPSTLEWEYVPEIADATLVFAGRYAQWKYYWSDDCVLRGRQISQAWGGLTINA